VPDNTMVLELIQGSALFIGCVIIAAGSLRSNRPAAAPYWNSFAIGIFALWVSLMFFHTTSMVQLGQVVAAFFATITICSLWLGMRAQNSRKTSRLWAPLAALASASLTAWSFLVPSLSTPRLAFVIFIILCLFTAIEGFLGVARRNFYAGLVASITALIAIALSAALVISLVNGTSVLTPPSVQTTGQDVLFAVIRFVLASALVLGVACLSAETTHRETALMSTEAGEALIGDRNATAILNRARQTGAGLALITVSLENPLDQLNVYGTVGLEEIRNAINIILLKNTSPLALIARSLDGEFIVMTETTCIDSTQALVKTLSHHLNETAPRLSQGQQIFAQLSFADTRSDGYEWKALLASAKARLRNAPQDSVSQGTSS